MRQMLAVAWLQFRLILKNKGYLAIMFVMPLVITAVFSLTSGDDGPKPTPVAVVDLEGGAASQKLIAALKADLTLAPRLAADTDQVDLLLARHEVQAGLVIRSATDLQMIAPPGGTTAMLQPAILRAATGGAPAAMPQTSAGGGVQERAVGFSLMFVMMALLMMSGTILQERKSGTLGRILTSPASRAQALGGYFLSFVMTGLFQFAVLIATSALLFHVHWGPVLPLAATATAIVLSASGLGLLLAGLVKTAEQQALIGVMVAIISSMLGGVYWPSDLMGETMQKIGHLTPVAWAMDGLQTITKQGADWPSLASPLAVLLGTALVTASVGVMRQRWD